MIHHVTRKKKMNRASGLLNSINPTLFLKQLAIVMWHRQRTSYGVLK